jgi:hypothetical protein
MTMRGLCKLKVDCDVICSVGFCVDCIDPKVEAEVKLTCPEIKAQILKDYIPQGGLRAGDYSLFLNQTTAEKCAQGCCQDLQCHFGLMINTSCYLV